MTKIPLLLCLILSVKAFAQPSGYSMVKEMGLKGHPKMMKEWYYQAYIGSDSQAHKKGKYYYASEVTNFNTSGNITSNTDYTFASILTNAQGEQQQPTSSTITNYQYTNGIYTLSTCTINNTTFERKIRSWQSDKQYTDSIFALIPDSGKNGVLTHISNVWLDDNYIQKNEASQEFYTIEVGHRFDGTLDLRVTKADDNDPKQAPRIPLSTIIQKDFEGNTTQEVSKTIQAGKVDYMITDYYYEYY